MNKIIIKGIKGYYYVEEISTLPNDNFLIYCYNFDNHHIKDYNFVTVSDLTELKVYQYNELVTKLNKYYPNYNINKLEGKFI